MTTPRPKTSGAGISVDIATDSDLWQTYPDADGTIRHALAKASQALPDESGNVSIVLTDDAAMRALNKRWRGQDKATNVLSFPARPIPGDEIRHLGDIVIAFETTAEEAERDGRPFAHHLAHLAVHGFLHLLGHDHESDIEADAMERLETDILARIGVPDPYAGDLMSKEAATLKSHA